jgi:hypothetical protein
VVRFHFVLLFFILATTVVRAQEFTSLKTDSANHISYLDRNEIPEGDSTQLKGRPIKIRYIERISGSNIKIEVWDPVETDGDIISLYFNGTWVLKDHTLSKTKKTITIQTNPEKDNLLTVYAENMGGRPPNTIAITIEGEDGKPKAAILRATTGSCEAIRFR